MRFPWMRLKGNKRDLSRCMNASEDAGHTGTRGAGIMLDFRVVGAMA